MRRDAELRAARLKAEVAHLAAKQASLEEQRAMQQEEVKLRLQREQLAKELELQVGGSGACRTPEQGGGIDCCLYVGA